MPLHRKFPLEFFGIQSNEKQMEPWPYSSARAVHGQRA